ncbi:MAG: response regulator [Planctomycetes bacterium]|nr:response regulator [Planctomycetota bacterium]
MLSDLLSGRTDLCVFLLATTIASLAVFRLMRRWTPEPSTRRVVWILVVVVAGGASWLAELAGRREAKRIGQMLMAFAPTYAREMEELGIAAIGLDTAADDPTYLRLIDAQKRWLLVNDSVNDIYTFVRDESGATHLLVDSETDYDRDGDFEEDREARTEIGEPYDEVDEELDSAFWGMTLFSPEPVTDRWGTWVSAYAPIHAPDGHVCGVLGVDYAATTMITAVATRRTIVLAMAGFLELVVLAAGAVVMVVRGELQRRQVAQRLLEEKTRALEQTNGELASKGRALEEANAAAMAATLAKSEFLANMSHEIRTPMTAILGFADVLLEQDPPADQRVRYVQTIQRSGQHLLTILNDILDLSKIEAGRFEIHAVPCAIKELVEETLQMLKAPADAKGIELALDLAEDVPPMVSCDPTRLRQVLVNLLGNAVKFTERGCVTLRARAEGASNERRLTLAVEDTGIGITQEQRSRLFKPFSQVDSSMTRHYGGTGLGLSISLRLVQMMGGTIDVTSEPGRGSRFVVSLPIREETAPADAPSPQSSQILPAIATIRLAGRVLIVEDGLDNQKLVALLLRKSGVESEVAGNGRAALERLLAADARPGIDLVLMDMMMPVMDGYEAARELRRAGFGKPIVAFTANALEGERDRCIAAGCSDFLTKPIDRRALEAVLVRHLPHAAPASVAPR